MTKFVKHSRIFNSAIAYCLLLNVSSLMRYDVSNVDANEKRTYLCGVYIARFPLSDMCKNLGR